MLGEVDIKAKLVQALPRRGCTLRVQVKGGGKEMERGGQPGLGKGCEERKEHPWLAPKVGA